MGALCMRCPTASKHVCNNCKIMSYCSQKCQTADWPIHKVVCRLFKKQRISCTDSKPRKPMHYNSLLLPESGPPRLFEVDHSEKAEYDQHNTLVAALQCDRRNLIQGISITHNFVLDRTIPEEIGIHFREMTTANKSAPNETIKAVFGEAKAALYFRGPIIITVFIRRAEFRDTDPQDYGHFLDFVRVKGMVVIPSDMPHFTVRVPAVRVNCDGEMIKYGRPRFECVEISPSASYTLGIAERLGFTLRRIADNERAFREINYAKNKVAERLDRRFGTEGVGKPRQDLGDKPGNYIVFRPDKKPLCPRLVQDLACFSLFLSTFCHSCVSDEKEKGEDGQEGKYILKDVSKCDLLSEECTKETFLRFCMHGVIFRDECEENFDDLNSHYDNYEAGEIMQL